MDSTQYDALPIEAVKKVYPGVVSIVISKYVPTLQQVMPFPMMQFPNPFGFGQSPAEGGHRNSPATGRMQAPAAAG